MEIAPTKTPTNPQIGQKILAMADEDMRVRAELAETGELFAGYAPRMEAVHKKNAEALEAIINEFGWPSISLVGDEASRAAHLVVQHAIGSPILLRRVLPLLQDAARRGEADPAQPAYLHDRICFYERRPQRYGTQFDWDENGLMNPWHLEDAEQVDTLRQAVGLEPLSEKIEQIRKGMKDRTPPNFTQKQAEQEAWARSVGWL